MSDEQFWPVAGAIVLGLIGLSFGVWGGLIGAVIGAFIAHAIRSAK